VLDRVCRDITQWREQEAHLVPVSMNVSAVQLERTKLRELIQQAMLKNRIGPQFVALELTEGSLFETRTGEFREDALATLRDLGVKIAIDDFGTGYSSLVLSQALARGLAQDRPQLRARHRDRSSDHAIVSAIVAMARSLNIQVVAEGIETWQQLEILRTMGCTLRRVPVREACAAAEALRYLRVEPLDLLESNATTGKPRSWPTRADGDIPDLLAKRDRPGCAGGCADAGSESLFDCNRARFRNGKGGPFPFLAFARRSLHACTSAEMVALRCIAAARGRSLLAALNAVE
jgi:hypothetical protein